MRRAGGIVTIVAATGLLLGACSGTAPRARHLEPEVDFVGVVRTDWRDQAMVEASIRLATRLVALGEGENVVTSPVSLQLALAMLREGALGEVAAEIDAAAGLSGDSEVVADLRAALAEYDGDVAGIDPDNPPDEPLLYVADAVAVQPGYPVVPEFLERVVAYHRAQVFEADFAAGTAEPVIDAWVDEETGGLIEKGPAELTPDTRVVLLDAVTFGASWRSEFAPEDTRDQAFRLADGSEVEVAMMHQAPTVRYADGDGWVAAELPYTEGFAMRVVLPDSGAVGVEQWVAAHAALDAAGEQPLLLTMPRWETDTTLELTESLDSLGLGRLVDPAGGLDGIFSGAFVSAVAQSAVITVAEKGTVAAAVTEIVVAESAALTPEIDLVLDRPFEYQVVHSGTGLVLFAGRVADPSAEP